MEFGNRTTALVLALITSPICVVFMGCSGSGGDGYVEYGQIQAAPSFSSTEPSATAETPAIGSDTEQSVAPLSEGDTSPDAVVVAQEDGLPDQTEQPEVTTVSNTVDKPDTNPTTSPDDRPLKKADQPSAKVASPGPEVPAAGIATIGPDSVGGEEPLPAEPRKIKLLISEKRLLPEGDSKALRLTYDDIDLLKILNMEPVPTDADKHFPAWLNDLSGQRIRIRGFMYPTFEATGLTAFTMARDNGICCFVRQPKIYDIIGIILADGETTDYIEGKPFDVEGVFRIAPEADDEELDDAELFQLYRIEDAKVLR
ncbi:MAG TPA: hypothetical protein EYG03_20725 [Planctomycetes bacterium]|nr:hypothetical protein [Fuerstiella sp.]HIK94375.1 hypothetical protein [Planctomycetota bacterium]